MVHERVDAPKTSGTSQSHILRPHLGLYRDKRRASHRHQCCNKDKPVLPWKGSLVDRTRQHRGEDVLGLSQEHDAARRYCVLLAGNLQYQHASAVWRGKARVSATTRRDHEAISRPINFHIEPVSFRPQRWTPCTVTSGVSGVREHRAKHQSRQYRAICCHEQGFAHRVSAPEARQADISWPELPLRSRFLLRLVDPTRADEQRLSV
jgi:hypothetical protein